MALCQNISYRESGESNGVHVVSLIVDGKIVDSKNIIK